MAPAGDWCMAIGKEHIKNRIRIQDSMIRGQPAWRCKWLQSIPLIDAYACPLSRPSDATRARGGINRQPPHRIALRARVTSAPLQNNHRASPAASSVRGGARMAQSAFDQRRRHADSSSSAFRFMAAERERGGGFTSTSATALASSLLFALDEAGLASAPQPVASTSSRAW
jgi:hypothetical protein